MIGSRCCHYCNEEGRKVLSGMDLLKPIYFIVCKECGNKRCPRATDHRLKCTGSNKPGQKGSLYKLDDQTMAKETEHEK